MYHLCGNVTRSFHLIGRLLGIRLVLLVFVEMAERVVVFMMIAVLTIQGDPQITFDAIIEAAQEAAHNGKWNILQNVLSKKYEQIKFQPDLGEVRLLKAPPGGHVYGESELTFHSSLDQGEGKKVEQSAGHRIINDDGHIKEMDFTPSPTKSDAMRVFLDVIETGTKPPPNVKDWIGDDGLKDFRHQKIPMFKPRPREGKATGVPKPFEDIVRTINGPLANKFQDMFKTNFSSIRDLKPMVGTHVYGKADLTVQSATAVNGKTIGRSASAHRVVNDDGQVTEFDYKPDETGLAKNLIELLLQMSGDSFVKSQRT